MKHSNNWATSVSKEERNKLLKLEYRGLNDVYGNRWKRLNNSMPKQAQSIGELLRSYNAKKSRPQSRRSRCDSPQTYIIKRNGGISERSGQGIEGQSQTFKYVGVYNNEMGILSKKSTLKERSQDKVILFRNEKEEIQMQDYLVNRYITPRRLRTVKKKK